MVCFKVHLAIVLVYFLGLNKNLVPVIQHFYVLVPAIFLVDFSPWKIEYFLLLVLIVLIIVPQILDSCWTSCNKL